MEAAEYRRMFNEAKAALEQLHSQKANVEGRLVEIDAQIEAMTQTFNAIAPLLGEQPIPTINSASAFVTVEVLKAGGITVAVRTVLDSLPYEDFSPPEIRDRLQQWGWDWTDYANPLSAIHNVLKRLVDAGFVREIPVPLGGKKYYSAKRETLPPPPPVKYQPPSTLKTTQSNPTQPRGVLGNAIVERMKREREKKRMK